jgi:hypothetical protein
MTDQQLMDQQVIEMTPRQAKAYEAIQIHLQNLREINKDRY